MARVKDEFGYRYNIPQIELHAINLVDNGAVPSKSIRKKSLRREVAKAYARKLRLEIVYMAKKSSKNKRIVMRKLRAHTLPSMHKKLDRLTWKRLRSIYNALRKNGCTRRRWHRGRNRTQKLGK